MEKAVKTLILPDVERAAKDLEEYERKYEASTAKLKKLSTELEKLKVQKQTLKAFVDDQKRTIAFYSNIHVEMTSKIQNILISQNKGKLVESSNVEKVKQVEAKITANTIIHLNDIQIHQSSGLSTRKEDLLIQKKNFEQIIAGNNKCMEELLNKIKPQV